MKNVQPEDPRGVQCLLWLLESLEWVMLKVWAENKKRQSQGHSLYDPIKLCSCSFTTEIRCKALALECQVRAGVNQSYVKTILVRLDKELQAGQTRSGIHIPILPTPRNKRLGLWALSPPSATVSKCL